MRKLGILIAAALAALPVTRALTADPWERLVDLEVYREAGLSVLIGRPVYEHLTPVPNLLPFTYPPLGAIAAVPLALTPAAWLNVAWTLGQLATLGWLVGVSFRPLLERAGGRAPLVHGTIAGAGCWLVPVSDGLRFGQVDLLLAALCLAGCVRGRGALVGAATALKLTPGVFVVHLWLAGRRRTALGAAGAAALLTVAAALILPEASADYWGWALFDSDRLGANAGTSNQSLRGALLRLGPAGTTGALLWVALLVGVASYGFRVASAAARADEDVRAVAVVGLLAVVLSPVGWIHHLVWVVIALGVLAGDGRSRRRCALAAAVAAYFAVPVPWVGVSVLGQDGPVWIGRALQHGYLLGALGLLVLLARVRECRRPPKR